MLKATTALLHLRSVFCSSVDKIKLNKINKTELTILRKTLKLNSYLLPSLTCLMCSWINILFTYQALCFHFKIIKKGFRNTLTDAPTHVLGNLNRHI